MTQHQKIIKFSSDGLWHCQNEYRANFIFSPHKRRSEIEAGLSKQGISKGKYIFEAKPCEHGIRGQKDYRMVEKTFNPLMGIPAKDLDLYLVK